MWPYKFVCVYIKIYTHLHTLLYLSYGCSSPPETCSPKPSNASKIAYKIPHICIDIKRMLNTNMSRKSSERRRGNMAMKDCEIVNLVTEAWTVHLTRANGERKKNTSLNNYGSFGFTSKIPYSLKNSVKMITKARTGGIQTQLFFRNHPRAMNRHHMEFYLAISIVIRDVNSIGTNNSIRSEINNIRRNFRGF